MTNKYPFFYLYRKHSEFNIKIGLKYVSHCMFESLDWTIGEKSLTPEAAGYVTLVLPPLRFIYKE